MARPRSLKPSYLLDKAGHRPFVLMDGRKVYLGPRGSYGTQATRDKYDRIIGEWIARGRAPDDNAVAGGAAAVVLTVSDVCLAFWEHALRCYPAPPFVTGKRPEGELGNYWDALRPLRRLYGSTPAGKFGPVKLSAVRDDMIKLGWCRNHINRNVARLKHVFKWAVGAELIPGEVWHRLSALEGLRKGRSAARETQKVRPVPDAQVDAVLPLLSPQVRAMIKLQRLTGARSGELCRMRTRDVDTSDKKLWVYRPPQHKTAHHDQVREIYLGPKSREILEPFLKPDLQAFVFSPAEAAE